jgi:hypothetical protein
MPRLNANGFVSRYNEDDPTYAPYQIGCGRELWLELEQTPSWPADTSRVDLVLSRMKADEWAFPDYLSASPRSGPLTVATFESALPTSYGDWKRCVVEFDGKKTVSATFWANFQRTTAVRAAPLTGLQSRALDLIERIRREDFDAISGWLPPGVLELTVCLASGPGRPDENYEMDLRWIIDELSHATGSRGLNDAELEVAMGLAPSWLQEFDELVRVSRSLSSAE